MKILQIIHSFPPHTMAGTEIYSYNLSRALIANNEVSVFFRIKDPKQQEYSVTHSRFKDIDCYAINNTFGLCDSFKETYQNNIIDSKFEELLDRIKPDVIYIHHLLFLSHGVIDKIKKRGIPIVFTLHDYWLMCYRGQLVKDDMAICDGVGGEECKRCLRYLLRMKRCSMRIYRWLRQKMPPAVVSFLKKPYLVLPVADPSQVVEERIKSIRKLCSKVDLFIAPSQFIREKFIKWGLPKEKVLFSPYGFDHKNFNLKPKTKSNVLRFGYMGTLLPMKGLDILIDAFKGVKNTNIELSIYGKAFSYAGFESYPAYLRKITKTDDRIKLRGGYPNSEIEDILARIDILVVPSIWLENSPLVIHEAFLSKTPVIASDIGGIPEFIKDGVNGLLFTPGNIKNLREKIEYLIDNPRTLRRFKESIPKVKNIKDNAKELEEISCNLIAREG